MVEDARTDTLATRQPGIEGEDLSAPFRIEEVRVGMKFLGID